MNSNIDGFPNYHVTNDGRIFNLLTKKERKLNKARYIDIDLYNNTLMKHKLVHRLVALAYVDEISGKPHVNHIDGDKHNNYYKNLEWVTPSENMIHAKNAGLWNIKTDHLPILKGKDNHMSKPIECISVCGIITEFETAREAVRLGYGTQVSKISNCCTGKRNKHNNHKWRFKDKNENTN